ncbi:uncharacterized protein LOC111085239 [Limulus polyphemus]|uniref:Uncharacterized protein LOC111085239 n=1 Tax=Limulus polyphemus TaxID=6850 RepID=A0ABM1S4Q5_LIMPO|nr:uncharacterized protein LOC111085239 [Limulus polyphemus]
MTCTFKRGIPLASCLMNISEAREKDIVARVARAALEINKDGSNNELPEPLRLKASVLNIFSDYDYNRSVITIVAPLQFIGRSVLSACYKACELINFTEQCGVHPRLGIVDLIPIQPLTPEVTLEECGDVARDIAFSLTKNIPGTSVFLFGHADKPLHRSLVERRKNLKWYKGAKNFDFSKITSDIGVNPSASYGITGIGAHPYVMNCNVTVDTNNVNTGQEIAKAIRASSAGGLPGVQAMAFPHEGKVEIACNVEMVLNTEYNKNILEKMEVIDSVMESQGFYVSPEGIENRVKKEASKFEIGVIGTAVVGLLLIKLIK